MSYPTRLRWGTRNGGKINPAPKGWETQFNVVKLIEVNVWVVPLELPHLWWGWWWDWINKIKNNNYVFQQ
ncbi:MAG: hypothetical protein K8S16_06150 [Bacteroidales bacterium]|nr:hypothetical protein [Bacteroidales bacterium]